MTRLLRLTAAVVLLVPAPALTGCNTKDESKPNPALKVPDVPPGGRDTKGAGMADMKKPR